MLTPRRTSQQSNGEGIAPPVVWIFRTLWTKIVVHTGYQGSTQNVAVSSQVFGCGVHDEISTELQWPLKNRRGPGTVTHDTSPAPCRESDDTLDIHNLQ